MICFPFFVPLEGKEGLVVGGSAVALRKIQKLLPYGPHLTVCAPVICAEIRAIPGLDLIEEPFDPDLLAGKAFVIAATDQRVLNARISRLCKEQNTLINVVDDRDLCSFIFPALVREGNLSVGICTGGASPSAAAYLKNEIQTMIPERFDEILSALDAARDRAKSVIADEHKRSAFYKALFLAAMERGSALSTAETEALLSAYGEEGDCDA